jgi:hypothetical protein
LITIEKRFVGKTPNTRISITSTGEEAIERHWRLLDQLRHDTKTHFSL